MELEPGAGLQPHSLVAATRGMSANSGQSQAGLLGWVSTPASNEMAPPLPIPGQLGVAGSCRVFLCHLGCMCKRECVCMCACMCLCLPVFFNLGTSGHPS